MKKRIFLTIAIFVLIAKETNSRIKEADRFLIFSEQNFRSYLLEINVMHPDVILAQAKIETGNFQSAIFRENKNLFGMKKAKKRKTTAIGENRGHAVYENWKQSVKDLKIWQDKYASKYKSKKQYLNYLKEVYAEDENYINLINKII